MTKFPKALILWLVSAIITIDRVAYAQFQFKNPIQAQDFAQVVKRIADILVKIGLPLATIFLVYAGLLFVTAKGNEEQLTKAKTAFYWTVLGAALVVGAYAIATAIVNFAQKL